MHHSPIINRPRVSGPKQSPANTAASSLLINIVDIVDKLSANKNILLPLDGLYDALRDEISYQNASVFYYGNADLANKIINDNIHNQNQAVFDASYAEGYVTSDSLDPGPLTRPLYLDQNLRTPVFTPELYSAGQYFGSVPERVRIVEFVVCYINSVVYENKLYEKNVESVDGLFANELDPDFILDSVGAQGRILINNRLYSNKLARKNFFDRFEASIFGNLRDQIILALGQKPWEIVTVHKTGSNILIRLSGQDFRIIDWMKRFSDDYS